MRVHYIQHVPFEGLGYIETWLNENNHSVSVTRAWEKLPYPQMNMFDALIILGGPMGVYDDHAYPWLSVEKNFILDAVKEEKKIIGICLGAQLLACVLGATICTNKHREFGWYPIKIDPSFSKWLNLAVPTELTVFHWHCDEFDIPYAGMNHASSDACNHQLFTYGDGIIGLQFHLEAIPETVQLLVGNEAGELIQSLFEQESGSITAINTYFEEGHQLMKKILEKICA